MYLIGICDDEERELNQIETLLEEYGKEKRELEYKTWRFTNGEALLRKIREGSCIPDLLLLDIFMPERTGIEVARELRQLDWELPVVFLTTSTEHALEAYGVDAVQYLVKPLKQQQFFHAMDAAMRQVFQKKERQIVLKISGGIRQIQPKDLVYCESQKNYQILYLTGEKCKVRMTTGRLWELLEGFPQFGRCGRSYILNMDHISLAEREKIVMDNGSIIYISRNKVAEFKKNYFSYYFDNRNENQTYPEWCNGDGKLAGGQ